MQSFLSRMVWIQLYKSLTKLSCSLSKYLDMHKKLTIGLDILFEICKKNIKLNK